MFVVHFVKGLTVVHSQDVCVAPTFSSIHNVLNKTDEVVCGGALLPVSELSLHPGTAPLSFIIHCVRNVSQAFAEGRRGAGGLELIQQRCGHCLGYWDDGGLLPLT